MAETSTQSSSYVLNIFISTQKVTFQDYMKHEIFY